MLLPALLLAFHTGPAAAPGAPAVAESNAVYNGRRRELEVRAPRIEAGIETDGRLDEPVWREAALLTGFSQFSPADGRPAQDSTEVLVWYSPTAIHFGIRAHEAHGVVNATLADRDRLDAEDRIEILLGTFDDGRQAFVFGVNPLGVQMDGTLNETGSLRVGGFSDGGSQSREAADLSPDFVFASKGRLTEWGYEVEVAIPFKSLRYQATEVQSWGLNVVRRVQHSGHEDSWAPASRAGASFLGQSGKLVGLSDLRRGLVLDVNPELTQRMDGERRPDDSFDRATGDVQVGGNVRWGITNNLTLNGTVRPDFSQVEADAGQFTFDPRQALFFSEKRPFFLEASELFNTPNNLVYTRRIVQPVAAAKLTGKVSGTSLALLSAVDDRSGSLEADPDHPVFNILRVQRDVGRQSRLGATYTDRADGKGYNRVASLDGRAVFREIYSARFQVAGSLDRLGGVDRDGSLWTLRLDRNARTLGLSYTISGIDPDFRTRSGFIGRAGVVNSSLVHRYSWYAPPGALWQSFTPDITLAGTWQYASFTRRGDLQDKKLHFNTNAVLRGGWGLGVSYLVESFGYDPALYGAYFVELPDGGGIVPFTGVDRLPNHDWVLNLTTPEWKRFSASVFYLWGQDENFFEWAPSDIVYATLGADWRPTDQLRVNAQYQHQEFDRVNDGSTVGVRRIPRLKVEYQVARPVFVRLVGEYDASRVADLRDDGRTNGRLMTYDPETDAYLPVLGFRENLFRLDALFSYQPKPGTVFFAGYGSLMDEPDALRFGRRMERVTDGFFVKASYLFRM